MIELYIYIKIIFSIMLDKAYIQDTEYSPLLTSFFVFS